MNARPYEGHAIKGITTVTWHQLRCECGWTGTNSDSLLGVLGEWELHYRLKHGEGKSTFEVSVTCSVCNGVVGVVSSFGDTTVEPHHKRDSNEFCPGSGMSV